MNKIKLLKWVQDGMPVSVDGKKQFLHPGATLDPSGEYCLVCDKNAFGDHHDGSEVVVSAVEIKTLTPLIPGAVID